MADSNITPGPASAPNLAGKFRIAGIVILVIGLASAGLVYWRSAPPDSPDELNTPYNNKRAARDVANNFGQWGAFSYTLNQDLQNPAIQAAIIAVASLLLSSGCFYIARLHARDIQSNGPGASNVNNPL